MAYLIACLSAGKGTWQHIKNLVSIESWEKVILITNQFGKDNFENTIGAEMIVVNFDIPILELKSVIKKRLMHSLGAKTCFSDVAVNITSGIGKEHMAILSALLSIGLGIRIVDIVDNRMKEL